MLVRSPGQGYLHGEQASGNYASALTACCCFARMLSVHSGPKFGEEKIPSLPLQYLTVPGACRKPPVVLLNRSPKHQNLWDWE